MGVERTCMGLGYKGRGKKIGKRRKSRENRGKEEECKAEGRDGVRREGKEKKS